MVLLYRQYCLLTSACAHSPRRTTLPLHTLLYSFSRLPVAAINEADYLPRADSTYAEGELNHEYSQRLWTAQ